MAAASEAGTMAMASKVIRQLRRNTSSTIAARTMPMRMASRTEPAAASTKALWSYDFVNVTPGGSCGANPADAASAAPAICTISVPGCW